MKKLFSIVTGLCFVALSLVFMSLAASPVITEVTPIPNPSTTLTPNYTFHSNQAGTIQYGGTCGSGSITNAVVGNNTFEYGPLIDGQTYSNCQIRVVNADTEGSNILSIAPFTVNTTTPNPPVLTEVTPIPNPSTTTTPSYVFNSTQAGTIQYEGTCGDGDIADVVAGNNTVVYTLTDGQTYSNCEIRVVNGSNEGSNILSLGAFTVNTGSTAPVITEVTPIPDPSTTTTPSYVFHSTQAGTIQYGGTCGDGDIADAVVGNNTVVYTLTDGQTYSNCQIRVVNTNSEGSNILSLGTFTINTGSTAPVITEVTPIPNPSTTTSPSYVFSSTQDGTIVYEGACGNGDITDVVVGNNTVTYTLTNGQAYSNCTIQVLNANNEGSNVLSLGTFTVNTGDTPPVITEVTPIPNPSTTTTPSYIFHSTQAGTIQYGGSCGNGTPDTAIAGNNTVTYDLVNGQTYSNCQIRVVNANNEGSNILSLGTFTVNTGANPPVIIEVTPIPNPSTTTTPSYVFSSTQAGTIVYGGSCGNGNIIGAVVGNNTVTYSLTDGQSYSDCTIQVFNTNNEGSNILSLGTFLINIGANPPVIAEVTPIPNPSTTTTPSYVFSSTQVGTITYTGACGSGDITDAVVGNNTVVYTLTNGQLYNDCTIQVVNANNEGSNILSLGAFTVNTGVNPPVIAEVTPIPNPSTTTTPSYTFSSTQAGTITYGGSCGNGDVANAIVGNNTVVYTLTDGQNYSDCKIQVINANSEGSNVLSLGTFTINTGANPPVITEVTPISTPSTTTTPSYVFSSTQAGTITYGGSCGNGDVANAIIGNNTIIYTLVNGQGYNDCTVRVVNASNEGSNILSLGSFIIDEDPNPPTPPVVYSMSSGGGSGKAGMRFSGQRRDDYARSGKFWDISRSLADIERINEGYLGRVTTYINRNGFRVFAGYLPGQLSLDYLNSRIQRTHKFVYRGERSQRSGNVRREVSKPWETHPQTYFRNRWAHNAQRGIEKAVAFDPKEEAMKIPGGQTWLYPDWRRGGVWARDHVSVNRNYGMNYQPLPIQLPRLSIRKASQPRPVSLGVRRVALQYTVAKGVSRIRPVRVESAASPAYEMYVTDDKNPWANDRFFNRGETLSINNGDGTGGRTIRIEMAVNPPYRAVIQSSQEAWEQSFSNRTNELRNAIGVDRSFVKPDSSVNRVQTLNEMNTGTPRYKSDLERWRAYKIQKANRVNKWEVRPFKTLQGSENYRIEI